jgi:hypothetical protein
MIIRSPLGFSQRSSPWSVLPIFSQPHCEAFHTTPGKNASTEPFIISNSWPSIAAQGRRRHDEFVPPPCRIIDKQDCLVVWKSCWSMSAMAIASRLGDGALSNSAIPDQGTSS